MAKLKHFHFHFNIHVVVNLIFFTILCLLDSVTLDPIALVKYVKKVPVYKQLILSFCCFLLYVLTFYCGYRLYKRLSHQAPHFLSSYKHMFHKRIGWKGVLNVVVTIILLFIADDLVNVCGAIFHISQTSANERILDSIISKGAIPLWTVVICSTFLAPLAEEVLYRACLLKFFKHPSNRFFSWTCLLDGIIFALAHVSTNIITFVSFMLSGMLLAHCYLKTRNLKTSIYSHMGLNLISWLL